MIKGLEKLPSYEFYKDSNLQWLGVVPRHWRITRLGGLFKERRSKVSDKVFPPLSVTKNGVLPQLESAAKTNDGDNRKLVKAGDFVINSRSDRKGSSGVSEMDGSVSLINIVLEPRGVNRRFCQYLFKSYAFVEEFYRIGHGIVADLWTTRYDEMRSIVLAFPPFNEQTNIVNFLDSNDALIDQAIRIKELQIELLKERKQALIQKAVTRGLDPDAPMRESGFEWIGKIPAHWSVMANRALFRERVEPGREDLPLLSVSIHSGVSEEEISEEENIRGRVKIEDKTKYNLVRPGDIAFNMMRAWQGAIGAVRVGGMVSPAYTIVVPRQCLDARYFEYQYRTPGFIQQMDRYSKGITDFRKRLYWDCFKQLTTLVPPIEEQRAIIEFIEQAILKQDAAVILLEQQITKLKEYKSTLINSAVTGKIKVPGVVDPAKIKEQEIA
ncbi:restriction endonuclease subunit S [Pseudomonas fluorescens]|uniref:Restriction endonuclease subunit S n=1 Tax=Pseudomonas fluorescens TaxID=294 RepID=A0A944DK84_PSEFL|nr:restriction endonuclease subunit S [Pseudomonas fluorescens]MBT2312007.1 restriction endonuclease subunit S [Pseudomonas fluorescens]MBT2316958.1 restriction endonuclease subunit S [Pseudomonas fluorescens]MBT2327230.1 restriction endonuclease subunit S [Pseudomonas fluorescens]MBT2344777.1 restriction endonuclease subunit S [Pseudomonas fluorescens]MBT2347833.1 restriction endonuclease subunit S [Pseudomonas fluorescens]